jgi:beta-ribofuranosylaminobenzene 5'-phosphate synthase
MMTRIVAPSRLHFGLFRVPVSGELQAEERAFGGVGLMIERPGVVVTVKPAETWQFEGPLASRAQAFAMRYVQSLSQEKRRPFQVLVERCPKEHTGLGVGTQLGLAVAKALAVGSDASERTSITLAGQIGRGERSAIGVHGFDRGGLVVEKGKLQGEEVSPLVEKVDLPTSWRVVLFTVPSSVEWHGSHERQAFETAATGNSQALLRLTKEAILPAARHANLEAFGDAIYEFNRVAGEPFAGIQGGPYSSPAIAALIVELRGSGIRCVGQSSWGPTVFAIVEDSDTALSLVLRFRGRMPVMVTRASSGHKVEQDPAALEHQSPLHRGEEE